MAYDHRKIGPSFQNRADTEQQSLSAQKPTPPANPTFNHIPSVSENHVIRGRILNSADYD